MVSTVVYGFHYLPSPSFVSLTHHLLNTHTHTQQTFSSKGAASFTIYNGTKDLLRNNDILTRNKVLDVACMGGLGGATAGALISFGSTRRHL